MTLLVLNFSDGCQFPVGGTGDFTCHMTLPFSATCPHGITATIYTGPTGSADLIETGKEPGR